MSSTQQAAALIAALAALDTTGTDAELIDEITALEQLKTAISARQARLTDAFAVSHRAELIQTGMKPVDARRSVCAQIALARRDSPHQGNRHVGLAHALVHHPAHRTPSPRPATPTPGFPTLETASTCWKPRHRPGAGRPPARPRRRVEIHRPAQEFRRPVARSRPPDR